MADLPRVNITDNHSFLAEELLIPHANKTDGSRMNMVTSQLSQLLVLERAETPLVFTNFENQVGKYSTGIKRAKSNIQILKILEFHAFRKLIIFIDENNKIGIMEYKFATNLTESFGFINHINENIVEDAEIEKDEILVHNGMYDELGNFAYGVNLKTVYLPYKGFTYEDPIIISESAARKLAHNSVHKYDVVLNRNDVLVVPIPAIGGEIIDGVICSRRRITNQTILDDFKNSDFGKQLAGDTPFQLPSGIVTNIEVLCNTPEDLLQPYNAEYAKIEKHQAVIYTELLELITDLEESELEMDEDVLFWKLKAQDYLDPKIPFEYDKRVFEGIIIRVEVTEHHDAENGAKLSNRMGGKGVVSKILPDEEMPITEDGERVEVVLNSLGVCGR